MRTEKIDEKRNSFKMLLFKLAVSQMTLSTNKDKSEVYLELERIYAKEDEIEDFTNIWRDYLGHTVEYLINKKKF